MNICFFTSEYVSPLRGGVERVTFILFNEFIKRGHNCYIISRNKSMKGDVLLEGQYSLLENNVNNKENIDFVSDFIERNNIEIIINQSHHQDILQLCKLMKDRYKCKLISVFHTHPLSLIFDIKDRLAEIIWAKKLLYKKILLVADWGIRYFYRLYNRKRYITNLLRLKCQYSDAFVLLSEEYIPIFNKFISINKKVNKLVAISNPIESSIDNQKLKKKKILWVGRMTFAAKRPDRIVKIWERIWQNCEGWELYMLGDGDAKNILEKYCVDKNIGNIYFEGNVNPKIYYEEASILCMTSSYEGFGMVLVEALQNRVIPIVYNSSEVFNDIIKEGETGFLIKAFKNGLYEKKLLKLVNDEGMRSEIIKNIENDDIFERLSLDTIYNKWMNLFNQI